MIGRQYSGGLLVANEARNGDVKAKKWRNVCANIDGRLRCFKVEFFSF